MWRYAALAVLVLAMVSATAAARADDLPCVSTTFRFVGKNDRVCVSAFDDPKVPGVACHISQARTGGVKGTFGLAEDPSRFSIACRQVGPISVEVASLPAEESVYSACQSALKFDPGSASNRDPSPALGQGCPGSEQEGPARSGATATSLAQRSAGG